jgi:hypothetical protein
LYILNVYTSGDAASNSPRGGQLVRAAGALYQVSQSDGDLFWQVSVGVSDAKVGLPGFAAALDAEQRWALLDFVRALAGAEPGDVPPPEHHHSGGHHP